MRRARGRSPAARRSRAIAARAARTAGTAYLYSADFYRVGLAHLRPGGLYCQWLPLHQLAVPDLEAIVASFTAAFPHVQLWVAYRRPSPRPVSPTRATWTCST